MKERIITLILLIAILLSLTNMVWAEEFTFRKTKWGMSKSDVKASEPLEIAESEDSLLGYKTQVLDKDVYVGYMFIEDQLVRSFYMLAESHSNKNDYINDYQGFKVILEKKYGKPLDDQTIWRNDLYKDDYSHWGMAIGQGHLIFQSTWLTATTEIVNVLHGDNFEISCGVQYKSINLKEIEEKAKEKKDLSDF